MPKPKVSHMNLITSKSLGSWQPVHGDVIVRSKILFGWWGVVVGIDNTEETVEVVRAGDPGILFLMSPKAQRTRTTVLDINDIKKSNRYTVHQSHGGQSIWYIS